ncbi:hypothetical protein G6F56_002125 [Rhizopus delemar]|nr:hypothetical protein G6F56_002125 [Rhizopus delemar]
MTFASLFKPLEDFERLSDDEDYDDPALYELFKDDWGVSPNAGNDWANDDDQSEVVTEEVQGRYRQKQTTLFSAWKETMKKLVGRYLPFLEITTAKTSTREEEASAYILCGCLSTYRMSKKAFFLAFRSSEEDHVLKKINELKNFNNVWLSTENFAKYEKVNKSGLEEASSETRRFNAVTRQGVASTVYFVRGDLAVAVSDTILFTNLQISQPGKGNTESFASGRFQNWTF